MKTEAFLDDGALIINIEKKGLFIVTGCAHSGIINTINYCQELGGSGNIYALIGGFHLTQASPQRISKTIKALREKRFSTLFLYIALVLKRWPLSGRRFLENLLFLRWEQG